jgi:hypothetical protein
MPTRAEYVRYLRSLEGGYGPARGLRNNDNQFNTWYYGRRVSGDAYAWCFVTECYAQNHFGILALNGGKAAYCPNAKSRAERAGARVVTHPTSTTGMQPGDTVYYDFNRSGEPEHTGTFVSRISSTEFYATEGNTSTSQYSDALALKRRSVRDVLWHIKLLGVDVNDTEEDMQLGDKVKIGDWMKKHWSKDKGITDGTIEVNTALGSGYGHARAAHENTDELVEMVTALQKTVTTLAATVADMDARTKNG